MKQEAIFYVGDKVFDHNYGWGVVEGNGYSYGYDLLVKFEKETHSYTKDGRLSKNANPSLSFTEYTLEGFSQERNEILPNKGEIVWVKDYEEEDWMMAIFLSAEKQYNKYSCTYYNLYRCTFYNPNDTSKSLLWKFLTTQNPYK